jgi:hypothetical protein
MAYPHIAKIFGRPAHNGLPCAAFKAFEEELGPVLPVIINGEWS